MNVKNVLILALFTLSLTYKIFAQTEQNVLPTEKKQYTIITEPITLYKGFFRVGISANYAAFYKIFDEDSKKIPLSNASGRSSSFALHLQYGITDRLQVGLTVPQLSQDLFLSYRLHAPAFNTFQTVKLEGKGSGISDMFAEVDYQFIPQNSKGLAAKILFTVGLPTGQKNPKDTGNFEVLDIPVGAGHISTDLAISARKVTYPYSWSTYISYKLNLKGTKQVVVGGPEVSFNDGNLATISGAFNYHLNEWLAFTNDVYFFHIGRSTENRQYTAESASWLVQYTPRLSFQIQRLRVNQAVSVPLIGKLSSADPSFIFIVQYMF